VARTKRQEQEGEREAPRHTERQGGGWEDVKNKEEAGGAGSGKREGLGLSPRPQTKGRVT
jgi:hypothetical protein